MAVKGFIKDNLFRLILAAVGVVLAIVAMVLSIVVTKNDGAVFVPVIIVTVIAVALAIASAIIDFEELGKIVVCGLYFCAMGLLLSSQLGNIGYYAAGIHDIGNGLQAGFIVGMILYFLAIVAEAITVFLKKPIKK